MTKLAPDQIQELEKNEEFDRILRVERFKGPAKKTETSEKTKKSSDPATSEKKKTHANKINEIKRKKIAEKKARKKQRKGGTGKLRPHLPKLEDGAGFDGRRPLFDPFIPGQSATMNVAFTGISAGTVELRVNPMLEVNGEKAYHFSAHAKTNSFFSFFYSVNDWADTYVRYKDLVPLSFSLHVRESKQFREARTFFDWKRGKARFWEKQVRGKKRSERKKEWELLPYSQNVVSAFFYIRLFKFSVGKKIAFRVADNGKNLIVRATVVRREKISTGAGTFDAHVLKLQFEYNGVFEQKGDIYVWVIDDPYQHLARIEAKIKLGTMSLELEKIAP